MSCSVAAGIGRPAISYKVDFGLGPFHLELLVPVGNLHIQRHLNGPQMFVGRAAQVAQTGVVER
jgi:hypothetical protein